MLIPWKLDISSQKKIFLVELGVPFTQYFLRFDLFKFDRF